MKVPLNEESVKKILAKIKLTNLDKQDIPPAMASFILSNIEHNSDTIDESLLHKKIIEIFENGIFY